MRTRTSEWFEVPRWHYFDRRYFKVLEGHSWLLSVNWYIVSCCYHCSVDATVNLTSLRHVGES